MIYVHVPYCRSHCTYCGFYSELLPCRRGSESVSEDRLDRYIDALCREIASHNAADCLGWQRPDLPRVANRPLPTAALPPSGRNTLYIGGGTPSLLSIAQLRRITDALGPAEPFEEFTMEVNPDDIVRKGIGYCCDLRKLGVNRISMGVQSFDDVVLRKMGRRHNAEESVEAYRLLCETGFGNISVDFILGFAETSEISDISRGLDRLARSGGRLPEHISCYQLSVEDGSGLEKMLARGMYLMPDDEECARRYYAACDLFRGLGYEHYEISNWAKIEADSAKSRRSLHNSGYWTHEPYVGFGPAAHSLLVSADGVYVRRWNNPDVEAYIAAGDLCGNSAGEGIVSSFNAIRGSEKLTSEQLREERLMLRLRTKEGDPESGIAIPEEKWFIADNIIAGLL